MFTLRKGLSTNNDLVVKMSLNFLNSYLLQLLKIPDIPEKIHSELLFDIDCSKGQQLEYKFDKWWDKTKLNKKLKNVQG